MNPKWCPPRNELPGQKRACPLKMKLGTLRFGGKNCNEMNWKPLNCCCGKLAWKRNWVFFWGPPKTERNWKIEGRPNEMNCPNPTPIEIKGLFPKKCVAHNELNLEKNTCWELAHKNGLAWHTTQKRKEKGPHNKNGTLGFAEGVAWNWVCGKWIRPAHTRIGKLAPWGKNWGILGNCGTPCGVVKRKLALNWPWKRPKLKEGKGVLVKGNPGNCVWKGGKLECLVRF